ncbi:C-terminal binding protein [Prosthecobacter vanneervenii]|uniref:Lactate dehydrogenase-like 2-hydroxyacid dehydrogenase n=1 Tax=Prosthecobacter vanneervenii TaxID=48466 RepID=A0A7W8DM62_9BACT|nr:C-terminal binding protein [Prosthecobacter vanneervenii]MBB5034892.1 lactate dehydrogenase-like 2-hydroxyacid dehydrogenase [Prosthecobacter vanneervenii]
MSQPHIAIIDWTTSPQGDPDSTIEREIIGSAARISRTLCETDADLTDEVCEANAIIIWHNMPLTAKGIARLKNCRAIIRNGVGFDSVDVNAARERGIAVCNVPDYGTEEVADHAIALAMALCRQILPLDAEAKQLGWNIRVTPKLRRLSALTFGIVGLGRIGTATALRAKALGFRVVFHDPYLPNGADKAVGITRCRSLDELLAQADVLSLHCPLNEETRYLISERELALLKPTSFVVNTARGAIIKKTAILAALYDGRLAGAGLDVIEDEPLRSEEEAAAPNLIATCHAAFCSVESKIEMRSTSARIALAAVRNEPLENIVNGVRS